MYNYLYFCRTLKQNTGKMMQYIAMLKFYKIKAKHFLMLIIVLIISISDSINIEG